MSFTNLELEKCAAREVAMRKNVFAKRGIGPKEEREIAMMEAIAEHFKGLVDLGPTGDFPKGKLDATDEGGINIAIGSQVGPDGLVVRIEFGKPTAWLGLPQEQAVQFAIAIIKHARFMGQIVIGDGGDDASDFG